MSFERAAIKRFNDRSSCAPPPTKYDPKTPQPHGSGAITFGQYSGRKEPKPVVGNDGFVTPSCKPRGRQVASYSASVRSCSDTRIRKGSRSRSASTKSLQDTVTTPAVDESNKVPAEDNVEVQVEALFQENEQLKRELELEEKVIAQINNEKDALLSDRELMTRHLEELKVELDTLQKRSDEQTEREQETNSKIAKLEGELDEQKARTAELQLETERLYKEESEMKSSMENTQNVHLNEMTILQGQIQEILNEKEITAERLKSLEAELEKEREKVSEEQSTFETDKTVLLQNIASLMETITELSTKNEELEEQQKALSTELNTVKEAAESHSSELQSLTNEILEKKIEIQNLQQELETSKKTKEEELQALQAGLKEFQLVKEQVDEQYKLLAKEVEGMKKMAEQDSVTIQNLNMGLLDERAKLLELQSTFEDEKLSISSKNDELQNNLSEIVSKFKQVDAELQSQKNEYRKLQEESALQIELMEDDRKNHEAMNGILTSEKQRLLSELDEIKVKLSEKEETLALLESQVTTLQKAVEVAEEEKQGSSSLVQSMQEEMDKMIKEMAELNAAHVTETQELHNEIGNISQMLAESIAKNTEDAEELNRLKVDLEAACNHVTESSMEIQLLRNDIADRDAQIADLQGKLDSEKVKREEEICATEKIIADLQSANGELQQVYIGLQEELEVLRVKGNEEMQCIKTLQEEIQSSTAKNNQIQSVLENENRILAGRNVELEHNLTKTGSTLDKANEQYRIQTLEMERLKLSETKWADEAKNLELANRHLSAENKNMQAEKDKLSARLSKVLTELSTLQSNNALLRDQFQNVTNEKEKCQEEIAALEEVLRARQEEEEKLLQRDSEMDNLLKTLQALKQENQALRENVEEYKSVYGDYANLASHQNTRQKIKHIVNIKEENIKLREENSRLRQKNGELTEKLRQASSGTGSGPTGRRFDPSQAFKTALKEPIMRDDREVRGPDARSTFTVPKKTHPKPTVALYDSAKKQSKQGMCFDVVFAEDKEN